MKELVIFDLDGTIISKQSQVVFLRYLLKKKFISFFLYAKVISWFIFYKAGFIKNPRNIMDSIFSFLKGKDVQQFDTIVSQFFDERLKKFIFPQIIDIMNEHKEKNRELIIISNAAEPIVKKVGDYLGIKNCISTKLETSGNAYTGKIQGDIIYGHRKVEALRKFAESRNLNFVNSFAYTDHISDLSLLLAVANACVVNPDLPLLRQAKKRNWPILKLKI